MSEPNHKGHMTETPDVSYIKNVDVTHEVSDVYISGIARFVVGLSILMIVSFFLMWGMFRVFDARIKEPPRSPMALGDKERLPPEPRLQGAPGFGEGLEKTACAINGTTCSNTGPSIKTGSDMECRSSGRRKRF